MSSPVLTIESDGDAQAVYDAFEREFSAAFSPLVVNKPGGVYLDNFVLRVTVPTEKPTIPEYDLEGPDPAAARLGTREAYWPEIAKTESTPIYSFERLKPGNLVTGPAVIEAELTTIVLPPHQKLSIDKHGFGIMESVETDAKRKPAADAALQVA